MPWKAHPKQGVLKGFVLTPQLDPVEGAVVSVHRGKTYRCLTDGTGFYALIDLPPGDCSLQVKALGYTPQSGKAKIEAGKVTTAHVTLGGAGIPLTRSLVDLPDSPNATPPLNGTPVRLENLTVTLGSEVFPGNLYVARGKGVRVRLANPPILPFQAGDVVAVVGTYTTVEGEATIDRAIVRLTDIKPASALPEPKVAQGNELLSGLLNGLPVRVEGSVVESSAEGFVVEDNNALIRVSLAGLKDLGVEAKTFSLTPPAVGAKVTVTGICSLISLPKSSQATVQIRPRQPGDVVVHPATSQLFSPLTLGVASLFFRPAGSLDVEKRAF